MTDLSHVSLANLKAKYISNGYRSIVYDTDPISKDGYMHCFMFDKHNEPFDFIYKFPCRVGYVSDTTLDDDEDLVDIYGRHITYKLFDNSFERYKWIKANKDYVVIVDAVAPEQDFLTQLFYDNTEDNDFNTQPLRIHFIDIETEISDSFEYPYTARNRINMLTVYDSKDEKYRTWALQKVGEAAIPTDGMHIVYDDFKSEADMLLSYVHWHSNNYPDVITGWNIRKFDMPYILRRLENTIGTKYANKMSPMNKYSIREFGDPENPNNDDSQAIEVRLPGIAQLDELLLYRDKFHIKSALSGGYSLSNVGLAEGLGDKLTFTGSLRDLYLHDWDTFYKYNVQDVKLTVDIETKLRLISLARQVVGFGLNGNYEHCYGSLSYVIGSLYIFAKKHCDGLIFPTFSNNADITNTNFEGAYVFDCVAGVYTHGIAAIDVASLYPNSIRASNISPETYVGKIDEYSPDTSVQTANIDIHTRAGECKSIPREQFAKLLKEKLILTKNNTLFFKPSIKHGILPQWCEHYYTIRHATKRQALIEHNKGNNALGDLLTSREGSLKLLLNTVYGIIGSKHCPFFNPDIAQSITRQGRFCNIESAKFIQNEFKRLYNIDEHYTVCISGDTDSVFFNVKCITDIYKQKYDLGDKLKEWPDEYKFKLWHELADFVNNKITPNIQKLLQTECHCEDTSMIGYELEYIGDVGIYQAKKNYGVHKIVAEGPILVDDAKYVGLEIRKATLPEAIKDTLKDVYDNTFAQNWTEQDFVEYIYAAYDKFVKLDVYDIAQWKGYATAKAKVGFLQAEKGATGIAKACQYYNDLIKKLRISNKHDEILVGSKVRFVYLLNNNPYGINSIAFNDNDWPKEFSELFQIDYTLMFDKCVLSPLKNFMKAAGYQPVNVSQQMLFDIFEL